MITLVFFENRINVERNSMRENNLVQNSDLNLIGEQNDVQDLSTIIEIRYILDRHTCVYIYIYIHMALGHRWSCSVSLRNKYGFGVILNADLGAHRDFENV